MCPELALPFAKLDRVQVFSRMSIFVKPAEEKKDIA